MSSIPWNAGMVGMAPSPHLLVGQVQEAHEGQGHRQVGGHGGREPVEQRDQDQSPGIPRSRDWILDLPGFASLAFLGTPTGIFLVPFP